MSKKSKIEIASDGTPVDAGEDVNAKPDEPTEALRVVIWTEKGEREGVFSEHGAHKAGDRIETAYAERLIGMGAAESGDE